MKRQFLFGLSVTFLCALLAGQTVKSHLCAEPSFDHAQADSTYSPEVEFDIETAKLTLARLTSNPVDADGGRMIRVIADRSDEYCYLLDFIGDQGFAVFDDDTIYAKAEEGDFPLLYDESVVLGTSSGFLKETEEGSQNYYRVDIKDGAALTEGLYEIDPFDRSTNWTDKDGELSSNDITSYLSSEHPDWTLGWESLLSNFTYFNQRTTSYYIVEYHTENHTYKTSWLGEGNCAPNAIFTYLYNLPTAKDQTGVAPKGLDSLLNGRQRKNVFNIFAAGQDALYDDFANNTYKQPWYSNETVFFNPPGQKLRYYDETWKLDSLSKDIFANTPHLYWQVRDYAIDHGYTPKDGYQTTKYGEDTIEYVSGLYDVTLDIQTTKNIESAISNIMNGIPVVMSVSQSKTYGNHAMTITGYRRYFKNDDRSKSYYLLRVADNWATTPRWFDPYKAKSITYYVTNQNSLEWPEC